MKRIMGNELETGKPYWCVGFSMCTVFQIISKTKDQLMFQWLTDTEPVITDIHYFDFPGDTYELATPDQIAAAIARRMGV